MEFEARVAELERRVGQLESLVGEAGAESPRAKASAVSGEKGVPDLLPDLGQLDALRRREGPKYVGAGFGGAVTYAGAAKLGDRELLWTTEHGLPQVLDQEPQGLARVLAALGHPSRLALVRALLHDARTSQELQEFTGAGSAGQLYHHLKELIAAGIVDRSSRSRYRISNSRVIPLLLTLAAAGDVASPRELHDDEALATPDSGTPDPPPLGS